MARTMTLPTPRRWPSLPLIAGVLVLAVIAAILTLSGAMTGIKQMIPGLATTTPIYQTTTVSKGNVIVGVTATGPISAPEDIPLTFKGSGKLKSVSVQIGDQVKQGQVLATLDTSDLQDAYNQAKASLATAQASLEKLQAGATDAQKLVAQTTIDNAKVAAADSTTSVASTQNSVGNDVSVAQATVNSATTSLATAQSTLVSAQQQETTGLAADQNSIAAAQKNLDAVNASVAANLPVLELAVSKAKTDLLSAQTSRDSTCQRSGASCNAANATVLSAETGVSSANASLTAGVKQGQQTINSAQAQLDTANTTLTSDQAKFDASMMSAQNAVKQAAAALASARASFADTQAKSGASVQSAQAQANQSAASVKAAQANYQQVVAPATKADLDSAAAQVAAAQAALDTAQLNLDGATLVAPADGTIAALNVYVGQWISGGPIGAVGSASSATMVLVNLSTLQVTAAVNEADIGKVAVGDPVTFDVSAFPNQPFTGKVLDIQPLGTSTQNVVNYNVTSSILPNKNAFLYPGMTATVNIVSAEHDNVLEVPNTALAFGQAALRRGVVSLPGQNGTSGLTRAAATPSARGTAGQRPAGQTQATQAGAGQSAIVVLQGNQLRAVRVALGLSDGTNTEVVSGLTGNELVVVGPLSSVTGGTVAATSTPRAGGFLGVGGFGP